MPNKIYYGDNLEVLRRYIKDESVDLCYIDPPFNSKRNYNQIYNNIGNEDKAQTQAFIDTWTWDDMANSGLMEIQTNYHGAFTEQSIDLILGLEKVLKRGSLLAYLISMTLRIAEIHRVLKPTGSFYLHCDPTASHYLRLVLDAVFCPKGGDFKNEISWKRQTSGSSKSIAKRFGSDHDTIFCYSKGNKYTFNPIWSEYPQHELEKRFKRSDEKGRYKDAELATYSEETLERLKKENRLIITPSGKYRYKIYLNKVQGVLADDMWFDIPPVNSQAKERLGYPTQKPAALLERIIKASSNEGDTVLDAYCGCGTTVAVAERLKRQWIGIDITYQSIAIILKRLSEQSSTALDNVEINGVPRDFESARDLANKKDDRTRKEFEKWIILTYSRNQAVIHDKKGGDRGIDGTAYITHSHDLKKKEILFSVKSGKTLTPAVIRELNGTIEREGAACGILLTLYPMPNLVKESKQYGNYHNELVNRDFPKIQVISVEDIFNGKLIDLPNVTQVLKTAESQAGEQPELL